MYRVAVILGCCVLSTWSAPGCRSPRCASITQNCASITQNELPADRESPHVSVLQDSPTPAKLSSFSNKRPPIEKSLRDIPTVQHTPLPQRPSETSLTLKDLEQIAFENNPTLAAAAARIEAAFGRKVQASLYPNPVLGYHGTQIGLQGTNGQQGGFVRQELITGGKLKLDQAIAGKETEVAHFQFHAQEQRILSDVRIRFYEVLIAERQLELTQDLAEIGGELVSATEMLLTGQLGTEQELLQAQIRSEESQLLQENAQNQRSEAQQRLAAVIGVPLSTTFLLEGTPDKNLPSWDWETAQAQIFEGNPELMAARAAVSRTRMALQRARREPIPNFDLSLSLRHNSITQEDVANVQVGIPIPIFNKNQGTIRHMAADYQVAQEEVRRIELALKDRLSVTYRRYQNALHQVKRYREKIVPKARASMKFVMDGYQEGQIDYLTLLTAQQTYVEVALSSLASLRELRTTAAAIEGQLLTGSLYQKTVEKAFH